MQMTTLQKVQQKIADLVKQKTATLDAIEQNKSEALAQISKAGQDLSAATEAMDLNAYEDAKAEQRRARMRLEMYDRRLDMVNKRDYVKEAESNDVLDSLMAYGDQIAEKFRSDVAGPLKKLQDILTAYLSECADINSTMLTWQQQIHPNYRNPNSSRIDPKTGEWTHRMKDPQQMTLTACKDAADLEAYLKTAADLLK